MDKTKQIWNRLHKEEKKLKEECVDILSKAYTMLGQKPDTQQVVVMASLLFGDLITNFSRMTMNEVQFAIEKGIRDGEDTSCFINVRTWNVWLKQHKKSEQLKRQQRQITDYQKHEQNQIQINKTINKLNYEKRSIKTRSN
jgi:hypothetical protein|tara:strand:+ start:166 stop:588 length:423 start_codon:yes stop_codon:yes gene_type:complete